MADELDDRLRDLARDAEPLVVLAGPQAARRHGERRRARRRAAAAGVAAALALAVGGWQLLPGLAAGPDTGTVTPAGSATATADPETLQGRLESALLPLASLPYASKWQWTEALPQEVAKSEPCGATGPGGPTAQATRTYKSALMSAVATYRLLAYPDNQTAAGQVGTLPKLLLAKCGIALTAFVPDSDGAARMTGTSDPQDGVTVWVESQGPYVAELFLRTPADVHGGRFQGAGVEECISASLARLTRGTPSATTCTGEDAARSQAKCKAAGLAGGGPTASC